MLQTIIVFFLLAVIAQAGVLRVLSYPFRVSPVKLFLPVGKVISYPVRHPVKTLRPLVFPIRHPVRFWVQSVPLATPIYRLAGIEWSFQEHGPTVPPDPWPDRMAVEVVGTF